MRKITGTLIWYYYICKREVWLMAHEINPFQDNAFLEIGRILGEESYSREKKEIEAGHIKIDMIRKRDGTIVVAEIKKSSRFEKAAKMQLLYYLYRLKKDGINVHGELLIPSEKKRFPIELTKEYEEKLEKDIKEIREILMMNIPPELVKIPFCRRCAYREFCWA